MITAPRPARDLMRAGGDIRAARLSRCPRCTAASGATGEDVDSLRNRNIVVTTPEKLDFALRNDSTLIDNVGLFVLDEAHTIGAAGREIRYEVLVQRLLRRADAASRRIVCLSAILPQGDQLRDFVSWVGQDVEGEPLTCDWRPKRQRFRGVVWLKDHAVLTFRVENEAHSLIPSSLRKSRSERKRNRFQMSPGRADTGNSRSRARGA
jgi:Lhr-like helicase